MNHLDSVLSLNEKHFFLLAAYLGFLALLYGLTELGIISIGSFILCGSIVLILYFIFKKQFNKTIQKLRSENDDLIKDDTMNKICKSANNEFCKRYKKKRDDYRKDISVIYTDYEKSL
jgi:hypothetical protein